MLLSCLIKRQKGKKTNNYFNKDVDVDITASDSLSGIKSMSYKITVGSADASDWKEIFPQEVTRQEQMTL